MNTRKPVRLTPSLREKIWGTRDLEPWHPRPDRDIGEIWFLSGCELPILVKLIYTSAKLSVQVHPDDLDGERGKAEMWYVLRAEPGAQLGLGFREPISRDRLREASLSGEIENLIRWIPVKAGEAYFAPTHTVHAIGAGLVLCEIQQNCDTTYRLYDYGRPRELHLEKACGIANTGLHPGAAVPEPISEHESLLVNCPHFAAESVWFRNETMYGWQPDRFHLLICTEGRGYFGEAPFAAGETWMIPPETPEFRIRTDSGAHFLRTYVPCASAQAT